MNIQTMIRRRVNRAGSVRAAARALGVDHAYLYRVMVDDREPGEQILKALGLERVIIYRKKKSVDKRYNGA